jgi:hypothetical protein
MPAGQSLLLVARSNLLRRIQEVRLYRSALRGGHPSGVVTESVDWTKEVRILYLRRCRILPRNSNRSWQSGLSPCRKPRRYRTPTYPRSAPFDTVPGYSLAILLFGGENSFSGDVKRDGLIAKHRGTVIK